MMFVLVLACLSEERYGNMCVIHRNIILFHHIHSIFIFLWPSFFRHSNQKVGVGLTVDFVLLDIKTSCVGHNTKQSNKYITFEKLFARSIYPMTAPFWPIHLEHCCMNSGP